MPADPILILQRRRMGDLLLAFPLLRRLQLLWPARRIRVVAEPRFFRELLPLAPGAEFYPPDAWGALCGTHYALAMNLSGGMAPAAAMADVRAERKLGPVADARGLRVQGFWQLYRMALTQNNHLNAFHWADLNLLDLSPCPALADVPLRHAAPAGGRRVGLQLGASVASKRPDAEFWSRLAMRLAAHGAPPVFLGGEAERDLGAEVARQSGLRGANFCGRLSLSRLAMLMRTLDLCVTPDTGPMHLADALGVPVLNLSMGPVHARETGPTSPGQWVLRAAMSCAGCWQCHRHRLYCKRAFAPRAVAGAALCLLEGREDAAAAAAAPGLALFRTGRDALNLHSLTRWPPAAEASCRPLLEDLWQAAFLFLYDPAQEALLRRRAQALAGRHPALARRLGIHFARIPSLLGERLRQRAPLPESFWRAQPGCMRLFLGYLHMFLQNEGERPRGWRAALEQVGRLAPLLAHS